MSDVVIHEVGHRGDGLSSRDGYRYRERVGFGTLRAEQWEYVHQALTPSADYPLGRPPRAPHATLYLETVSGAKVPYNAANIHAHAAGLVATLPNGGQGSPDLIRLANGYEYIVYRPDGTLLPLNAAYSNIGSSIGSALGRYIGNGLGFAGAIAASGVLSSLGSAIGDTIAINGVVRNAERAAELAFNAFDNRLFSHLKNAAIGSASSLLAMELGRALGVSGFGGELLNTATSSVVAKVASNIFSNSTSILDGLSGTSLFKSGGGVLDGTQIANPGMIVSAVSSFIGSKLGSLIISPTTTEGALLASIGSTVGSIYGGAILSTVLSKSLATSLNFLAPGIGALIGFVGGALIGKLFFGSPPKPWAAAETNLNLGTGFWDLGAVTAQHGGNKDLVTNMALVARDTINGVIAQVAGREDAAGNANPVPEKHRYRYEGGTTLTYKMQEWVGGTTYVDRYTGQDASAAVDMGVLLGIRDTKIVGGDIYLKRAIANYLPEGAMPTSGQDIVTLLGNMQIAEDYARYMRDPEPINRLMAANPNSAFTAAWAITLLRAEELNLNRFQRSDLNGGLKGFLDSLDVAASGLVYEDVGIDTAFNLYTPGLAGRPALFASLPGRADQTNVNPNGQAGSFNGGTRMSWGDLSQIDYGVTAGGTSNHREFFFASNHGQAVSVNGQGGDDVMIGSGQGDTIWGGDGRDWVQGHDGNDMLFGGAGNDVLIAGADNDNANGEDGDDYISGGMGADYTAGLWNGADGGLWGGNGNDTLVGGEGQDLLMGGSGDDLLLEDQDGQTQYDYRDGGAGRDLLSFERFSHGVAIDLNNGRGQYWHPEVRSLNGDHFAWIEGLAGTQHADQIWGDEIGNVLNGLGGNDQIWGRDGDDTLEGGAGADVLDGGAHFDTASYENSSSGVSVDLASNTAFGGDASGDSFVSIEGIRGSRFADVLAGDAGNNFLVGGFGDDVFVATGGADQYHGGAGFDTIDFSQFAGNVWFQNTTYWTTSTGASGWHDDRVERLIGSAFHDELRAGAGDHVLEGGGGTDYLYGGDGGDTYVFAPGSGQDYITDTPAGNNALRFEGVNWRDLAFEGFRAWEGAHLTVINRVTGDRASVLNTFQRDGNGVIKRTNGQVGAVIKSIDLAGAGHITLGDIDHMPWTVANDSANDIRGSRDHDDILFAYGGDDYVNTAFTHSGTETRGNVVYAGDGNDLIWSSSGADEFIFERGNGVDYLYDTGGIDTVVFGPSVAAEDVTYEIVRTSNQGHADLVISVRDPNNPNGPAADRIVVVDGGHSTWNVHWGWTRPVNSIEFVRVGGQQIDLRKIGIQWSVAEDYSNPPGGGGGGGGNPPHIPPIVFDLDGDGLELRSVNASRLAAVDADGVVYRTGWVGQDDGILVLDRNGDGRIDRQSEISFVEDVKGAKTDLEGLAAYDSDGDGRLTSSDERFDEFRVWRDLDQDGVSSDGELMSLKEAGIAGISLKGRSTGAKVGDGAESTIFATTEVEWTDKERVGQAYDVALAIELVRTDGGREELNAMMRRGAGVEGAFVGDLLASSQALTKEQGEALRARREAMKIETFDLRFGRIEQVLGSATAKIEHGVWTVDTRVLDDRAALAKGGDGGNEAIAAFGKNYLMGSDDWTAEGSVDAVEAARRATYRAEAEAVAAIKIEELRSPVSADSKNAAVEYWTAAETKATSETSARDAASAVPIKPPSLKTLVAAPVGDTFRLLPKADEPALVDDADGKKTIVDAATTPAREDAGGNDAAQQMTAGAAPTAADDNITTASASEPIGSAGADAGTSSAPSRLTAPSSITKTNGDGAPAADYLARIEAANATLINAMARFGASNTMARVQQVDREAGMMEPWASVSSMPSVQRMLQVA